MTKRWQYPSWSIIDRDALTRPEVTTPDKWWQPFSEPVRQNATKLALTVLIATSGIAPIDPEILTQPEATSLDKWYRPLFGIGVEKQLRLSGPDSFPQPPIVETITLDKWYQQFSEPLQVKTPINVSFGEFRTELELAAVEDITLDKWYYPLVNILGKTGLYLSGETAIPVPEVEEAAEEITLDKWYQPFSEPDLEAGKIGHLFAGPTPGYIEVAVEGVALDKWYVPFSEFLHTTKRSAAALEPTSVIDSEQLTLPEETLVSRWYQPHSEPVLVKPRASEFPSHTNDTEGLTLPEVTSVDKWHQPLSEFLYTTKRSAAALEPASVIDAEQLTLPEETLVSKWVPQTNEPVRIKARLLTALQEAFSIDANAAVPPPENITLDKWYSPFVGIRVEEGLRLSGPTFFIAEDEAVFVDKWYQPLSEFLYRVKRSAAALEPASVIDADQLTRPEETLVSKWVPQTNEPVRLKDRLLTALQEAYFPDADLSEVPPEEEITLDKYWQPLGEPVWVKPRASEFPPHSIDSNALTQSETTTVDRWWRELSEPVRVKARLHESLQLPVVADLFVEEVITLDKWYAALSEPVLVKAPLPIGSIPHVSFDVGVVVPIFSDWFVPLSAPFFVIDPTTPLKAYLFIDPVALTLPETITIDKWYVPLEEPVRLGDRLVVPFRLPASVGFKLPITAVVPVKTFISKEGDQTHLSLEADMTLTSLEGDQTKDSKRC